MLVFIIINLVYIYMKQKMLHTTNILRWLRCSIRLTAISEALHSQFRDVLTLPHTEHDYKYYHIPSCQWKLVQPLDSPMSTIAFSFLHFHCSFLLLLNLLAAFAHCRVPSTLEGPFDPVTVPFDRFLLGAVDLPPSDPRVRRRVQGFEPEQISLSLSTTHDSVWISWITGISG